MSSNSSGIRWKTKESLKPPVQLTNPTSTSGDKTVALAILLTGLFLLMPGTSVGHDGHGGTQQTASNLCLVVTNLTPFVDELPIPAKATPARARSNYSVPGAPELFHASIPEYDMPMSRLLHSFHRDLPAVEVWGYGGSYPGPTFDVVVNQPVLVNWSNALPAVYPAWLPADTSLHGVTDQTVRTVVHLHGGANLPRYDGYPTNWYRSGESDQYYYGNQNFSGTGQTMWYHDHALGVTANNVYAGLAGFYFLRNPAFETNLNLPKEPFEIPLVFQDRDIQTNCEPASLSIAGLPWKHLMVVNGKVTPCLEVEPRRYRFRALNGSGFRTYAFVLQITDTNGTPTSGVTPPPYHVIGNDGGFLPRTALVQSTNPLPMMPGERIDFILDFSGYAGTNITMINRAEKANPPSPPYITNMMQFRVTLPLNGPDTSAIPDLMIPGWEPTSNVVSRAEVQRQISLDLANESPFPGPPFTTNGAGVFALLNLKFFHEPVSETPRAGDTEIWSFVNLSADAHPMHLHLLDFRVIDRVRFAGWNTNEDLAFPPSAVTNYINDRLDGRLKDLSSYLSTNSRDVQVVRNFEGGPKDVVRVAPFAVTRIAVTWPTNAIFYNTPSSPVGDPNTRGLYIYHCHILDHEDNDMMRPLQLLPPFQPDLRVIPDPSVNLSGFNRFRIGIGTRAGQTYRLETATSVTGGWQPLASEDVSGTGGVVEWTPPPAANPILFYRARRVDIP